ncbi:hypothetical protein AB837_00306 [bacterium AB1]|nr:hypothetical protein AB837_00306 [bacterium AB1]
MYPRVANLNLIDNFIKKRDFITQTLDKVLTEIDNIQKIISFLPQYFYIFSDNSALIKFENKRLVELKNLFQIIKQIISNILLGCDIFNININDSFDETIMVFTLNLKNYLKIINDLESSCIYPMNFKEIYSLSEDEFEKIYNFWLSILDISNM